MCWGKAALDYKSWVGALLIMGQLSSESLSFPLCDSKVLTLLTSGQPRHGVLEVSYNLKPTFCCLSLLQPSLADVCHGSERKRSGFFSVLGLLPASPLCLVLRTIPAWTLRDENGRGGKPGDTPCEVLLRRRGRPQAPSPGDARRDGLSRLLESGVERGAAETKPQTAGGARSTRSAVPCAGAQDGYLAPGSQGAGPAGVWSSSLRAPAWVGQATSGLLYRPSSSHACGEAAGSLWRAARAQATRSPSHASRRRPTREDQQSLAASVPRPSGEASCTEPGVGLVPVLRGANTRHGPVPRGCCLEGSERGAQRALPAAGLAVRPRGGTPRPRGRGGRGGGTSEGRSQSAGLREGSSWKGGSRPPRRLDPLRRGAGDPGTAHLQGAGHLTPPAAPELSVGLSHRTKPFLRHP
ncbi:hypothetical protein AAY473_006755 [Plecturocebus cupreus]